MEGKAVAFPSKIGRCHFCPSCIKITFNLIYIISTAQGGGGSFQQLVRKSVRFRFNCFEQRLCFAPWWHRLSSAACLRAWHQEWSAFTLEHLQIVCLHEIGNSRIVTCATRPSPYDSEILWVAYQTRSPWTAGDPNQGRVHETHQSLQLWWDQEEASMVPDFEGPDLWRRTRVLTHEQCKAEKAVFSSPYLNAGSPVLVGSGHVGIGAEL